MFSLQIKTIRRKMKFAYQIEQSISKNDPGFINQAFDLNAIINNVTVSSTPGTKDLMSFNFYFAKGFVNNFDYGSQIVEQLQKGDSYSFLRRYKKDGQHHIIFRLFAESGLNYHDYTLALQNDEIKIVDVYFYITGEKYTETLERLYLTALFHNFRNENFSILDKEYISSLMVIKHVRALVSHGRHLEAQQLFEDIPPHIRQEKFFQIMYIQLAKYLCDEAYLDAIDRFREEYPYDPSLYLIALDGFFIKKKYEKALLAIDELDNFVGGDPILNLYRGNVHHTMNDYPTSLQYYNELTTSMPTFEMGYLGLFSNHIELKEYESATRVLRTLMKGFRYRWKDIDDLVAGFVSYNNSHEYHQFRSTN